jgi:hypothetical protein
MEAVLTIAPEPCFSITSISARMASHTPLRLTSLMRKPPPAGTSRQRTCSRLPWPVIALWITVNLPWVVVDMISRALPRKSST